MKKIFSFLLLGLLLSIGNVWADQAILPNTQALTTSFANVGSDTHIQIKTSSANTYTNPLRFYTNVVVTIQAADGYVINSVTYEASSTGNYVTYAKDATVTPNVTPTVSGKNVTWTFSEPATTFTFKPSAQTRANSITINYSVSSATPTVATPTFTPAAGTYTSAQNVVISTTTQGATIYYTTDGSTPTTNSSVYSSAINVSSTTTIKAFAVADGYDNSAVASATYTFPEHAGTLQDPYSVADAQLVIPASGTSENVYIRGIVSQFKGDNIMDDGTNYRYYISDDGTTTNQLLVFKGKGLNNVAFSSADDLLLGDEVVILGGLTIYNSTKEIAANNYIVSLQHVANPVINAEDVNVAYDATSGEIAYTISNPTEATLTAASSTPWISNIQVAADKVTFTTTANVEVLARKGFITLSYTGALDKVISVMQAAYPYPNYTWDLSEASYNEVEDPDIVTWPSAYATMTNKTGTSATAASNYLGGDANNRNSSRFYKNNIFSLIPTCGYNIICVVFTATSNSYATALKNSSWINATASAEETTVVVTPTDGNTAISATIGGACGFTEVIVYYEGPADSIIVLGTNGWSTFAANYKFETTATVYKAVVNNDKTAVVLTEVENAVVPAGVGVILKGAQEEDVLISPSAASASDFSGNQLVGVTSAINAPANGYVLATIDQDGITKFHPCNATVTIPANKAYIAIGEATAPSALRIEFAENDATNIMNVDDVENAVKFLENGQLFIKKNGVIYDAMGKTVR